MFNDDVSAINSNWCNVISGEHSISSYSGNTRKDYVFNGGKWYLYRTQYSNYGNYDISMYECSNLSDLNSNAQYVPFFYGMAFCLFVFVVLMVKWSIGGILGHF